MRMQLLRTGLLAGLALLGAGLPAEARPRYDDHQPLCMQPRGADLGSVLILRYYEELPQRRPGEAPLDWMARLQEGVDRFKKQVGERYTEGTLQRLLDSPNGDTRRAALMALGMLGSMKSSAAVAGRLQDEDTQVRQLASEACWSIWFRGDADANNKELERVLQLRDRDKKLTALDALIKKAPNFAEAYNQRAILHFQAEEWDRSIADCEKAIQLNPHHFGALSGAGQCYLRLGKHKQALKVLRDAYRVNPNMDGVEDTIRALEEVLGEEGKKEDRR